MAYLGAPALKKKLEAEGGVRDVGAVIGSIGRKKYGKDAMAKAALLGRRKGHGAAAAFIKGLGRD